MDQGQSWQVIYSFKNRSIRHVHGLFCDPYDNRIWVTTGDNDHESAIWLTDNQFRTLEQVVGGSQQSRAFQLLFTQEYVYFGTDTPFEKNYIYRINKRNGSIEKVASVHSSVYWSCKVGGILFFSTAIEPSRVNKCRDACIWGSSDGENWKCVAQFRKDALSTKYFQFGQILFPDGINNSDYLWFTPLATEKDQTIERLNVKKLF